MITIQILLFALIVHEMRILEFEMQNGGIFEKESSLPFSGQSLNKCLLDQKNL